MTQNKKSATIISFGAFVGLVIGAIMNQKGYLTSNWWGVLCAVIGAIAFFAVYRGAIALYTMHAEKKLATLFTSLSGNRWFLPAIGWFLIIGLIIGIILVNNYAFGGHEKNVVTETVTKTQVVEAPVQTSASVSKEVSQPTVTEQTTSSTNMELASILENLMVTIDAHMDARLAKLATKEEVARLEKNDALAKASPSSSGTGTSSVADTNNDAANAVIIAKSGSKMAKVPALLTTNIVLVVGDNNNVNVGSAVVYAEHPKKPMIEKSVQSMQKETAHIPPPDQVPTRLQEPSPQVGYSDTQVTLYPGCRQTYIIPRGCYLHTYWPEIDQNAIQVFYDGRLTNPYPHYYDYDWGIQSYGYRNVSTHPIKMIIRVTLQPRGWHR